MSARDTSGSAPQHSHPHKNTMSRNEKFWVDQVTAPPRGTTRGGERQGGGYSFLGHKYPATKFVGPHPGLFSAVRVPMRIAWGENPGKQPAGPAWVSKPVLAVQPSLLWTPQCQSCHWAVPDCLLLACMPLVPQMMDRMWMGKLVLVIHCFPKLAADPTTPILPPGRFIGHRACMLAPYPSTTLCLSSRGVGCR